MQMHKAFKCRKSDAGLQISGRHPTELLPAASQPLGCARMLHPPMCRPCQRLSRCACRRADCRYTGPTALTSMATCVHSCNAASTRLCRCRSAFCSSTLHQQHAHFGQPDSGLIFWFREICCRHLHPCCYSCEPWLRASGGSLKARTCCAEMVLA